MVLDKSDMLSVLDNFPHQCKTALSLPKGITTKGEVTSIVIIGMGGSGIPGDLLQSLLSQTKIPIFVVRDYKVPNFVDEYTLVFSISYSGNTEETIEATKDARQKGAQVMGITSGGELPEHCEKTISIPKGLQPRAALGFLFFPIVGVLYNSNLIEIANQDLNEMLTLLQNKDPLKAEAEEIAKKIQGKYPLIYGSNTFAPVAMRWKTQINENANYMASFNTFSEMNHNELNAFELIERNKYTTILICDKHDHPQIKKRMNICKELFEKKTEVHEVEVKGTSLIARLFYTIYLGDYVSYYLALRERVDPTPVETIEWFKTQL